ncbi:MAG: hypothetical protein NZM18_13900 [Thermoflexales bacterium]|nr:hypothetical protein [Thermoflexales bacterium]MDW8350795.1 hypothetical protein [Anaerolineae bacterium]
MSNFRQQRVIRASEIGQYAYCARAWWLSSVVGVPMTNAPELQHGTMMHRRHGRLVSLSRALVAVALGLVGVALVVLAAELIAR